MAVDCMLGTTFIDCHFRAAVQPQRKIFFRHAPSVAFLGAAEPSAETASDINRTKTGAVSEPPTSRNVRLVKTVTAPPMTQVTVRVSTPAAGPSFLQSHSCTTVRHLRLLAEDVMDVIPHQPLMVCVRNFGDQPVHLPKQTKLGIALSSLAHIMTTRSAPPGVAGVEGR